jgi:chaperonin GroEL
LVTGGKFISAELGIKLENVELADLGRVKHAVVTREHATFIDGAGDKEVVRKHAEIIKEEIKNSKDAFDTAMRMERYARITGGIAVLKVGATTDTARREKRQRIEDSVNATRAALEEGIVPGGGLALYLASLSMLANPNNVGEKVLLDSLLQPMRKIASNAGVDPSVIIERLKSYLNRSDIQYAGYNAATDTFEDLVKAGIIDPVKVTRTALESAASIAGLLLTTEAIVADEKQHEQN